MRAYAPWRIDIIQRGLRLHELGMTYRGISIALGEYHGLNASPAAVRSVLRCHGAPARKPGWTQRSAS